VSVDTRQAVLDRVLEERVNATEQTGEQYSDEFQKKYTGIWTKGAQYKKDEDDYFFGIVNATKFHNDTNRYVLKPAGNAIRAAWTATKEFFDKRWYMKAMPLVLALGIGMYTLLKIAEPPTPIAEAAHVKPRKKSLLDYGMKYFDQGKQKVKEITGNDEPQSK